MSRRICAMVAGFLLANSSAAESGVYRMDAWRLAGPTEVAGEVSGRPIRVTLEGLVAPDGDCEKSLPDTVGELFSRASLAHVTKIRQITEGLPVAQVALRVGEHDVDLGLALVRSGVALADMGESGAPDSERRRLYLIAEDEARAEGVGVWKCASPLAAFERAALATGVAAKTLYSIAMNESKFKGRPWPWTLNVSGKPYYFNTRKAAWRFADGLIARGIRTFDVGHMQVNWRYHAKRFKSIWEALQPSINQKVAGEILLEKYRQTGNPIKAVGWYHNANPVRNRPYMVAFAKHYLNAPTN